MDFYSPPAVRGGKRLSENAESIDSSVLAKNDFFIARRTLTCLALICCSATALGAILAPSGGIFQFSRALPSRLVLGLSADHYPRRRTPEIVDTFGQDAHFLVYASDEKSAPGVVASIRSVRAHATGPLEILYVGEQPLEGVEDVHYRNLDEVAQKYNLEGYENPTHIRSVQGGLNTNPANYVRFAMDKLLPHQTKAMWIDADTIVECDVYQMMTGVLLGSSDGPAIAAVPRAGAPFGLTKTGRHIFKDIDMSFNAGMYVVRLDRWRERRMSERVRQVAITNRREKDTNGEGLYKGGSQPPFAIIVREDFEHLPLSWNVKMSSVEEGLDQDWICLMHWSGPLKPWEKPGRAKLSDVWFAYGDPVAIVGREDKDEK